MRYGGIISHAGIVEIVREGYVDHTQFDPDDPHYDSKSSKEDPKWFMVDVKFLRCTKRLLPLAELRALKAKDPTGGFTVQPQR